jgi:cell division septal protein FtsQ
VYTDPDVLQQVVDAMMGDPVLLVDTAAAEDVLRGVPWVDDVRITTDFPHRVFVDIRERRPVVSFQGSDQKFRVIDVEGRVLDVIAGQPVAYLLVTGDNPDTPRGGFAGAPYAAAARLVSVLPSELRAVASSVRIDSGTSTLSLVLDMGGAQPVVARLGDSNALDDKLARLLQAVRNGLGAVCQVDVSTSEVGLTPC